MAFTPIKQSTTPTSSGFTPIRPAVNPLNGFESIDAQQALPGIGESLGSAAKDLANRAAGLVTSVESGRPASEIAGKAISTYTGAANALFSPISGALNEISNRGGMVGKTLSTIVSKPFELIGRAGSYLTGKAVDALPLSEQTKNNLREPLQEAVALATQIAVGEAIPKVFEYGKGKTAEYLKQRAEDIKVKNAELVDKTVGQIIQGSPEDIAPAKKALQNIDTSGIETYGDLYATINDRVGQLAKAVDARLEADPTVRPVGSLTVETTGKTVGGRDISVKHNFVEDAFRQLAEYYAKTNSQAKLQGIVSLYEKAKTDGLTIKEINDLARAHGTDLNAYNANGELASGLTKQAAENTRAGLKTTVKELSTDKVLQELDPQISALSNTKDLIQQQVEAVNKLQQKIKPRTYGEEVGRRVGQLVNLIGLNSPKGLIEYFLGRGTGLKTLNALDLEKALRKNLSVLKDLLSEDPGSKGFADKVQGAIDSLQSSQRPLSNQSLNRGETKRSSEINPANIQKKKNMPIIVPIGASIPQNNKKIQ